MGVYYKIVNVTKRQYLDAGQFGENIKASGFMYGYHGMAVALLVCDSSEVRHDYGALAGSWCGDRIIAAGDDNGQPDAHGLKTSTADDPQRNLNGMASDEFEDISYPALAMLCSNEWMAEELVEKVAKEMDAFGFEHHPYLLVHLGDVVTQMGCGPLERQMVGTFGPDWIRLYARAAGGEMGQGPSGEGFGFWNVVWAQPPEVNDQLERHAYHVGGGVAAWPRPYVRFFADVAAGTFRLAAARVDALLIEDADTDDQSAGTSHAKTSYSVAQRWTMDQRQPEESWESYCRRAAQSALAAIDAMETDAPPDRRPRLRYRLDLYRQRLYERLEARLYRGPDTPAD